jgi:hypothetical protein
MHHLPRLRRTPVLACCIVALVMVAGGIAYAAIPDSNGVIHACYLNAAGGQPQGSLRVIDTAKSQTCKATETALNFNQTGPQGAPGAAGAPGPKGAAGPKGATGAKGPAGVNDAWWSSQLNLDPIEGGSANQSSLFFTNLVAGSYLLNVTAALTSFTAADPGEIDCVVDGADEQTIQLFTQSGFIGEPSLGEMTATTPEDPQIVCDNSTGGPVGVQIYASATRVADLHH